ncbi:MAG TPA: ATP-binding cassette domain-containing protein [Bacteroidales bacterium]|nr:ATP-binding cassette domain-containing protein [Bacteroidales bacterium]HSA43621.1 ATP-binding cassette domain-containing protein [Bacteroidales bacterium]
MIEIHLKGLGKKYNANWVFRGIHYIFKSPGAYAILGNNGSGKSTLLQMLSSRLTQTEGEMLWINKGTTVKPEEVYRYYSMAAPYQDLIEEYTVAEHYHFHAKLQPFLPGISEDTFMRMLALPGINGKAIKYFSSGMKQRVKLALAILSDVPLLLLDEPCSNLDKQGTEWYRELIGYRLGNCLITVCSNHQPAEIAFCGEHILINDFK